jgi:hypothetical protein
LNYIIYVLSLHLSVHPTSREHLWLHDINFYNLKFFTIAFLFQIGNKASCSRKLTFIFAFWFFPTFSFPWYLLFAGHNHTNLFSLSSFPLPASQRCFNCSLKICVKNLNHMPFLRINTQEDFFTCRLHNNRYWNIS